MPNWCSNSIMCKGSKELIEKLSKALKEGKFLETLRPEPKHENDEDWYNWRVDNWGAKWDVGTEGEDVEVFDEGDGYFSFDIYFTSAWSPPTEAYAYAIEHYEDLTIEAYYYESGCDFAGTFDIDGAETLDLSNIPDDYFENNERGKKLEDEMGILRDRMEYFIDEAEDNGGEFCILILEETE